MADRRLLLGYALLVVTALGWSGAWITARLAAHDAPPLTVTVGRFAIASVALVPAWLVLDRRRAIRITGPEWRVLVGMSATGITTYTVLFLVGVSLAPASDGAILTPGFVGLFALLFAWGFRGERPGLRPVVGAFLSLLGCLLVGWNAVATAGADSTRVLGDLVFVASAAAYGAYTVLGKQVSGRVPAATGILLASAMGALLLAPVALAVDGVPDLAGWSARAWLNVVYLGLVATAVCFVTYYVAVEFVGIGRTAPALGLVPVFTVALAAVLLGERLTVLHAVGGVLVMAGILWSGRRRVPQRTPA